MHATSLYPHPVKEKVQITLLVTVCSGGGMHTNSIAAMLIVQQPVIPRESPTRKSAGSGQG